MARRWPEALDNAACRGMPPEVFDGRSDADVDAALGCCSSCTVTRSCKTWMRPSRTFYDGVAAGRLWRNGKAVDPATPVDSPLATVSATDGASWQATSSN